MLKASVGYATFIKIYDLQVVAEGVLCLDQVRYSLGASVTDVGVALEGEADQALRLLILVSASWAVSRGCSIAFSLIGQYRRVSGSGTWAVACADRLAPSPDIVRSLICDELIHEVLDKDWAKVIVIELKGFHI